MGVCRDSRHRTVSAYLAVAVLAAATSLSAVAGKFNAVLKVGQKAPTWIGLLGVDGKRHALADLRSSNAVLLVFLSNRCPMTRNYEPRLKKLASEYRKQGLAVVGVSIGHAATDRLALDPAAGPLDLGKLRHALTLLPPTAEPAG